MLPALTNIGKVIIFVASRSACEEVLQLMRKSTEKKMLVDSIHGDKHQSDRNTALSSFRKGKIVAIVATDVTGGGLDVADVQTVVNFDAAKNLDSHVNRVGRAGRLVKNNNGDHEHNRGVAYTLLLDPQHLDFANVLIDVFQRERRDISDELMQLSLKKRAKKWNKKGLGLHRNESTFCDKILLNRNSLICSLPIITKQVISASKALGVLTNHLSTEL